MRQKNAIVLDEKFSWLSPYLYCANNPVNLSDPTGKEIQGVTKEDARLVVQDFRNMFPGEDFEKFRDLIVQGGKKQNGKSLANIPDEALSEAFEGIDLNEDQKTLVEMVVNTINSNDIHKIEYLENSGNISSSAERVLVPTIDKDLASTLINGSGGIPVKLIENLGKGGLTSPTSKGTYSLVFKDSNYHQNGRAVTTGHEIIGHGRSLALGRGHDNQHVDAVLTRATASK